MKKNLIISAFSNLYTDQRIQKVAETLHNEGYKIEIVGNDWGGSPKMERPYDFHRISLSSTVLKFAYLEFNWKLYKLLHSKLTKNTILYANDLDALLPNYLLAKKHHLPLIYDSHELFSEMPSINGRWTQKIWRYLEKKMVPNVEHMITASQSYASWFKNKYNVCPIVLENAPRKQKTIKNPESNTTKIIIYQGVINPYRGIDKAILAMKYIENTLLIIAGDGPKKNEYEYLVIKENLQDKVRFLGKLDPVELRKITETADCGLSIEEPVAASYLYSLPNKVLDYIQAKVPVVLANLPEMCNITEQFKIGEIIPNHDPKKIANTIKKVLNNPYEFYENELNKAAERYSWENQEKKLLELLATVTKD